MNFLRRTLSGPLPAFVLMVGGAVGLTAAGLGVFSGPPEPTGLANEESATLGTYLALPLVQHPSPAPVPVPEPASVPVVDDSDASDDSDSGDESDSSDDSDSAGRSDSGNHNGSRGDGRPAEAEDGGRQGDHRRDHDRGHGHGGHGDGDNRHHNRHD